MLTAESRSVDFGDNGYFEICVLLSTAQSVSHEEEECWKSREAVYWDHVLEDLSATDFTNMSPHGAFFLRPDCLPSLSLWVSLAGGV